MKQTIMLLKTLKASHYQLKEWGGGKETKPMNNNLIIKLFHINHYPLHRADLSIYYQMIFLNDHNIQKAINSKQIGLVCNTNT